jgi:hypothetical protein
MRRRGVILIEVIVACGLAAVLLTICVQVLTLMAVERRAVERRVIALQEAANLIEQASAIPFAQLTRENLNTLFVDPALATLLPDAKVSFSVDDEQEPLAKRVTMELSWLGAGRRRESPVRLTTWVFAPPIKEAVVEPTDGGASAPAETPAAIPPVDTPQSIGGPAVNKPAVSESTVSEPAVIPPGSAEVLPIPPSGESP